MDEITADVLKNIKDELLGIALLDWEPGQLAELDRVVAAARDANLTDMELVACIFPGTQVAVTRALMSDPETMLMVARDPMTPMLYTSAYMMKFATFIRKMREDVG